MREGVSEILYNKSLAPDVAPGAEVLEKMHIITTSSSSIVYNVIAKLGKPKSFIVHSNGWESLRSL